MSIGKQVRLDSEVVAELAKIAQPFENPNKVLRRLLGLDKTKKSLTAPKKSGK